MTETVGLRKVRFDKSLGSFNRLWSTFKGTKDRIEKSESKVVAKWRLFPPEIVYALGAVPYDLLLHEGFTETTVRSIKTAGHALEAGLSADSCLWNISATGGILSRRDSVPVDIFLAAAGLCDISSKSWRIMSKNTGKPLYSMETPIFNVNSEERATSFIQEELASVFERLGRRLGYEYSERRLLNEIRRGNIIRKLLLDITTLLSRETPPLAALEYFIAHTTAGDYLQEPDALATILADIKREAEARVKQGESPPEIADKPLRIYYVGEAPQDLRFWNLIENSGGILIGCDTYLPLFYELIPENGSPMRNFARWIWTMPHHMPSLDRAKTLIPHIERQRPDAAIIGNVMGCRNLALSDRIMKETLREELGVPVTSIDFSSSDEDVALLEPHIRSFIEMCR